MIRILLHTTRYLILLYLCFIMTSCVSASQTQDFAIETTLPELTIAPQHTSTNPSTQKPEFTTTPLSIPSTYKLPSWLADPNYAVFAMVTNVLDNSNEITFVNANTHEKFIIDIPDTNIARYFWTPDGKSIGFIESGFLRALLIDLKTGIVTEHSVPEKHSQCLDEYQKSKEPIIRYLPVYSSLPLDSTFLCPESNLHLSQQEKQGKAITIVENLITGQKIELDSIGNLLNLEYTISPSQTQLAILQGAVPDPDARNPMGTQISVYSLITGQTISYFEGQFCSLKWSPDENKLLTTKTNEAACNSNVLPVILYPKNNQSHPITAIENAQHSAYYISTFNWSLDSNFLYYVYINPDRSDICRYDLISDKVICLTKDFGELSNYNIESYIISPDERFLAFSYGYSCQGCDYWGEPSSVLIRIDGSDLFFIGKEIYRAEINSPYPYSTLIWRPILNP